MRTRTASIHLRGPEVLCPLDFSYLAGGQEALVDHCARLTVRPLPVHAISHRISSNPAPTVDPSQGTVTSSSIRDTYDVEALRRRDAGELERLVRNESDRIFRCVRRLIRDDDEARSLVQETFLQAIGKFEGFRGDSKVSTWLCAIAINLARSALRKSSRLDPLEEDDIDRLQPAFTASGRHADSYTDWNPEAFVERNESHRLLHDAIDRLPEAYKTVIVLRDMEELPAEEVAEILGLTEGTMRVRLHRARQALRKLLDVYLSR